MHQNEFVIFAELNRDRFDEILQTLKSHFENIEYGRQGDDYIWIHLGDDKLEIDSFYSLNLEVKGRYRHRQFVMQVLREMENEWIFRVFDPPKTDMTR